MAKTCLKVKALRKPKFKVRAYTRCMVCGRPHSVYRKFGLCRICLREKAHRGELPGCNEVQLVNINAEGPRPGQAIAVCRAAETTARKGVSPNDNDRSNRRYAHASA